MELERWDPWEELTTLHQEVDRLFGNFFNRVSQTRTARDIKFAPPVDVYETEIEIVVRVALPGVIEEDIDVELKGEAFLIRGECDCPLDAQEGGYHHQEWRYGQFERAVVLPTKVQENAIKATLTNGVLEIRAPKS
ncbi:MAG: Hsp20/alpha crystallin family protein [Deltaproteobacteria bacterium]|nr:Hsp20/alpha crystallin family protein [Deltaproteobacteria bacterium]